ncbi:hypothetical protein EMCRGX_G021335, partial [Ephydatia muelleri]
GLVSCACLHCTLYGVAYVKPGQVCDSVDAVRRRFKLSQRFTCLLPPRSERNRRRESSRGSCSPSKRPLLGGECTSGKSRCDGDFDRQLGTIPVYFLTKLYFSCNLIKVCR